MTKREAELIALLRELLDRPNWENRCHSDIADVIQKLQAALAEQPEQGKTVRVRIPVAVNADAHWQACGANCQTKSIDFAAQVRAGLYGSTVYFIEADVPLPQSVVCEGKVVKLIHERDCIGEKHLTARARIAELETEVARLRQSIEFCSGSCSTMPPVGEGER